tara:strand:+ start:623 stop:862 length:240 start_codon:yes stop_codon:yes gene_type:complete
MTSDGLADDKTGLEEEYAANIFESNSALAMSEGISTITGPGRPFFNREKALLIVSITLFGSLICSTLFVIVLKLSTELK